MKIFSFPLLLLALLTFSLPCQAADSSPSMVVLPAPKMTGGKPLMETLAQRQANRNFSTKPISEQSLSDLLWSAWGINREDGRRTIPTAKNQQKVALYVAMHDGVWRYEAKTNSIIQVSPRDLRQKFKNAPLTLLVAVAKDDAYGLLYAGALVQNAALYCASEGLANVVKSSEVAGAKGAFPLPQGYELVIVQSVGWPN